MSSIRIPTVSFEEFKDADGPIIDIRSPIEFSQGHWPRSTNIPLFSNKERELVGITYKEKGQKQALAIGIKLIIPKLTSLKASIELVNNSIQTENKTSKQKHLRIYCWRGGLRSTSLVWLCNILGFNAIKLEGGYKSYRRWVLDQFNKDWGIHLIGGKTGTGKTNLLKALSQKGISTIDLEGLANHRGSSFGSMGKPLQPSCEHYENLLAESLNNLNKTSKGFIWLEDESPNLGNCRIPNGLIKQMKVAPLVEISRSKNERVEELISVYSNYSQEELSQATLRIKNRLGPQRTKIALDAISDKKWEVACKAILDYYDKCYEYQLEKITSKEKVNLSGIKSDLAAKMLIKEGIVS